MNNSHDLDLIDDMSDPTKATEQIDQQEGSPDTVSAAPRRFVAAQISTFATEEDAVDLGIYAEKSYLEYAMSVVKSRALPEASDGQKPVQRRILYAMWQLGLTHSNKPVKSARIVGEILGKYHPHGDASAYEAMVRIAQDFSLRYPLVDGHGNFGSRDGDSAAAMRYTEARLTPLAEILLSELDKGTVDFVPNYDGTTLEPEILPARLPVLLLNGASGIAVGMATEIPPHNLTEVAEAGIALIKNPHLSTEELLSIIPAPDFPGGGQIISAPKDLLNAYETGRGSLKIRCRWQVEELARGQWQIIVTELPYGTSTQKVLEEIEEYTNPKIKKGKKALSQDQIQTRQLFLSLLDQIRDESGREQSIRLVLEPKSSRQKPEEMINTLLAHTSLETNYSLNMVMIGLDGRPQQKPLKQILAEWITFRFQTVRRRTAHRLQQVVERIHILEGRLIVFLNIDEVIRIIREAEDPKRDLIAAFALSERQADDILEIRLRQLARLEAIKLEKDLGELRKEQLHLEHLLNDEKAMRKTIIAEIEADKKKFGDKRRTLVKETEKASVAMSIIDEPITVILSQKGWIRSRQGHGLDLQNLTFKEGDALLATVECRSTAPLALFGTDGRVYSIIAGNTPGGRGDGVPITTLIELTPKTRITQILAAKPEQPLLIASSSGYAFTCRFEHLFSRQKMGKQFITLEEKDTLLKIVPYEDIPGSMVACLSQLGKLHLFPLSELKMLAGGGRGMITMALDEQDTLSSITISDGKTLTLNGTGRGGKPLTLKLDANDLAPYIGKRARRGKPINTGFKLPGF
jgi:topoisomerase-4 subunit A